MEVLYQQVQMANTFTVTIDGTFTVLTIRNTSGTGIVAGGQFIYANGGDLTCTSSPAIVAGIASVPVLQMTLASPNIGTFNVVFWVLQVQHLQSLIQ
jgi:hypothetical protein